MIVADTNFISYLSIRGLHTSKAQLAYARDPLVVLPPLWRSEFLNVLVTSVRAGLLTENEARAAWQSGLGIVGGGELEPDLMQALGIGLSKGISGYDAQFIALAEALDVKLVTAERRLVQRCPERAVLLDSFAAGTV